MKRALLLFVALGLGSVAYARRPATRGAVAADHRLASEAGAAILRAGGNAVDAAVAATLAQGVVQPSGSGLGGGGFAIVAGPKGIAAALDFRETAPSAATRDMFAGGASSQEGGLAVATPSEAFGLVEMHSRWGRLKLADVAAPAIRLAEEGFGTGPHLAAALLKAPDMQTLLGPDNRRPALAGAIRALVDTRGAAFRNGWVAADIVSSVRAAGGILQPEDLRDYRVEERPVLRGALGGRTVLAMPPPSGGGIGVLQILMASGGGTTHCQVEAAKHAMAERAAYGGDPASTTAFPQPSERTSWVRVDAIRQDCGPRTHPPEHYGPPGAFQDAGTMHVSVMDADGWAVALTSTVNTAFGSRVIATRSGIVLNNEMDDFTTRPGKANAFGLIQGAGNAVVAGRRPLSSMSPTVVLGADGTPELAAGASGGPMILTATAQVLEAMLERGAEAQAAVSAPRWHHQWIPDTVLLEAGHPARAELAAAGHAIAETTFTSAVQVVRRRPDGTFDAASDPRKHGEHAVVER
ncbi:MAG: hypothetical protein RLZZ299_3067 [Pseudomonadota bacterium]|jgi:gamma-glutamyltranspeptidase/glutathione hydrolase